MRDMRLPSLRGGAIGLINKCAQASAAEARHDEKSRFPRRPRRRAGRGADAAGFLQGLLTNDVEKLGRGEARYAALLTPQGKILFDFLVLRAPADAGARF